MEKIEWIEFIKKIDNTLRPFLLQEILMQRVAERHGLERPTQLAVNRKKNTIKLTHNTKTIELKDTFGLATSQKVFDEWFNELHSGD